MKPDAVLKKIEKSRDDIITEMCDMIKIPALSPIYGGSGESRRADYLMQRLSGFDSVKRIDLPDQLDPSVIRSNILAKKEGKEA